MLPTLVAARKLWSSWEGGRSTPWNPHPDVVRKAMVRIDGQIVIARPVEEVFDFVADERNEPRYNPGCVSPRRPLRDPSVSAPGTGRRWRAWAEPSLW